jgi:polyribonucleotide nucleotidyltransferase
MTMSNLKVHSIGWYQNHDIKQELGNQFMAIALEQTREARLKILGQDPQTRDEILGMKEKTPAQAEASTA